MRAILTIAGKQPFQGFMGPSLGTRSVDVYLLPRLIPDGALRDRQVFVIDVLRATSTIITALAHGVREIIPSDDIGRAREVAAAMRPCALLGGERNGSRIEGFDLGNSPLEYTSSAVAGRSIVLATTNGTCAMFACRQAREVLIAALVNVSAVLSAAQAALADGHPLGLICSGTDGMITAEDALAAGYIVEHLRRVDPSIVVNDQARLAQAVWLDTWNQTGDSASLARAMFDMHGGRNLVRRGMQEDIFYCATFDLLNIVPRLELTEWSIRT